MKLQLTLLFIVKKSMSGKILAEENLGILVSKQYGGGGTIQDYFAVMETLSYHDLSLVIKFEYNLDFGNER
jgi:hypothetical protein